MYILKFEYKRNVNAYRDVHLYLCKTLQLAIKYTHERFQNTLMLF